MRVRRIPFFRDARPASGAELEPLPVFARARTRFIRVIKKYDDDDDDGGDSGGVCGTLPVSPSATTVSRFRVCYKTDLLCKFHAICLSSSIRFRKNVLDCD